MVAIAEKARNAMSALIGPKAEPEIPRDKLAEHLGAARKGEAKAISAAAAVADEREEVIAQLHARSKELGEKIAQANAAATGASHRVAKIEAALRRGCPPEIAERGPVLEWLRSVEEHVRTHFGVAVQAEEEMLQNLEGQGYKEDHAEVGGRLVTLRREMKLRKQAAPILDAVADAEERVRALQLELEPDIDAALEEIRDAIPAACPCGENLGGVR